MNNRDKLIALITDHKLERREVAAMLSVNKTEVDQWLLPRGTRGSTEVPAMAIELLDLKLHLPEKTSQA